MSIRRRITDKEIESELKRYKTKASKKAYLTRWLKASMNDLKDINDAYEKKTHPNWGYLYGERIVKMDVVQALQNVLTIQDYRRKHFEK